MDDNSSGRHMLFFGYGECADALKQRLTLDESSGQAWDLTLAVRRPTDIQEALPEVMAVRFSADEALVDPKAVISQATHVLISVPPGPKSDHVLAHHKSDLMQWGKNIEWIGYLSSTGVYGDRDGEWVSEETIPRPKKDSAIRRFRAEQDWFRLGEELGVPVMAFRLAGLYGKGRNALIGVMKKQVKLIHKEGHYFSRVHFDDVAQVLVASISKPNGGTVYNVCDDLPTGQEDPIKFAAELLGAPLPEILDAESADMTAMPRSLNMENRRVRNDRIKNELGVELLYPTYKEGLQQLYDDMQKRLRK